MSIKNPNFLGLSAKNALDFNLHRWTPIFSVSQKKPLYLVINKAGKQFCVI